MVPVERCDQVSDLATESSDRGSSSAGAPARGVMLSYAALVIRVADA